MTIFLLDKLNFTKYFIKCVQKTWLVLMNKEVACLIPSYIFQNACMIPESSTNDCKVVFWNTHYQEGKFLIDITEVRFLCCLQ